jgi:hypothetical protein
MKKEPVYKAIMVKKETHRKFALRAKKEELKQKRTITYDELINQLIK